MPYILYTLGGTVQKYCPLSTVYIEGYERAHA